MPIQRFRVDQVARVNGADVTFHYEKLHGNRVLFITTLVEQKFHADILNGSIAAPRSRVLVHPWPADPSSGILQAIIILAALSARKPWQHALICTRVNCPGHA